MKVDINLLPEEHRPKRWTLPLTVGLIIIILAVGYYGYGFYGRNASANSELDRLQSQLDLVNAEIQKVLSDPIMQEYEESIAEAEAEIEALEAMELDYETHNAERIYWKQVIQTVREEAPSDVILTSFEQNGGELVVEGKLGSDVGNTIPIVEYARRLETRGIFSRSPAIDIAATTETGEDGETEEIFIFTILLEIEPGGTQ